MTDALALGEKLLSLLDESARTTTYKPALLLALIDRVQEHVDHPSVPVRLLAERVIELYWPQTLPYQTTGKVLNQSQTCGRAKVVAEIDSLRRHHGTTAQALPETVRSGIAWTALLDRVEETPADGRFPAFNVPLHRSCMSSPGIGRSRMAGRSVVTEPAPERSRCFPGSGRG